MGSMASCSYMQNALSSHGNSWHIVWPLAKWRVLAVNQPHTHASPGAEQVCRSEQHNNDNAEVCSASAAPISALQVDPPPYPGHCEWTGNREFHKL